MSTHNYLLYTAKVCPFAQRSELALELAGAKYESYHIDLFNKPEWYAEQVNRASKVPALVVDEGKPESYILPESLVIVEHVADLFDEGNALDRRIHATDAKTRADARYLVERFAQIVTPHYIIAGIRQEATALGELVKGLQEFNDLVAQRTPRGEDQQREGKVGAFIHGDRLGFADVGVAPFVARILLLSRLNHYPLHDSVPVPIHTLFESDASLSRLRSWWEAVTAHPAWKATWNPEAIEEALKKRKVSAAHAAKAVEAARQ